MSKLSLNIIVITALVVLMTALTSCKSEANENAKLLETIIINDSIIKFEYDNQNRIVKVVIDDELENIETVTMTLTYSGDKLTSIVWLPETNEFSINGNDIMFTGARQTEDWKVNDAGLVIFRKIDDYSSVWESIYHYEDGNLKKQTYKYSYDSYISEVGYNVKYDYDEMNSPVSCNTPKWFLQYLISTDFTGKNNPVSNEYTSIYPVLAEEGDSDMSLRYFYEYDNDGFPISRVTSSVSEETSSITLIRYRGE